jgi:hypothetical protein
MASVFRAALARHRHDPGGRRWVHVPYDQTERMAVVMSALRRRSPAQRLQDERTFEAVRERLIRGERIDQPSLVAGEPQ